MSSNNIPSTSAKRAYEESPSSGTETDLPSNNIPNTPANKVYEESSSSGNESEHTVNMTTLIKKLEALKTSGFEDKMDLSDNDDFTTTSESLSDNSSEEEDENDPAHPEWREFIKFFTSEQHENSQKTPYNVCSQGPDLETLLLKGLDLNVDETEEYLSELDRAGQALRAMSGEEFLDYILNDSDSE